MRVLPRATGLVISTGAFPSRLRLHAQVPVIADILAAIGTSLETLENDEPGLDHARRRGAPARARIASWRELHLTRATRSDPDGF